MIKSIKASVGSVKLHPIRLSYGLTPSDIDFEKRLLFVNRQLCRIAGQRFFIETPKSETGARTVPLTEKLTSGNVILVALVTALVDFSK